jgi:hypothetical protein
MRSGPAAHAPHVRATEIGGVMGQSKRVAQVVLSLVLLLGAGSAASCSSDASPPAPSPHPAVSVSALPASAEATRVITVFIRDRASAAEKLAMAHEIAQMPEVEAYHFVTKRAALDSFAKKYSDIDVSNLPVNPLPASFQVLVRDQADVASVARRFYDNPIVYSSPGTHDGVQVGGSIPGAPSPSP